ncbi:sensor of ECF-type sigma factor [Lutibacter sp.]|uniref:sensor of ECF-type sigma factor n=1 Tax=Lutibacter sp. TaxID=1925666 RepID=UPI001A2CF9A3|nr:sensor of ECF-type sigma factor [Lutibacter sp.]MBI9041471.1 sensor of ECF-type sigma factor [Lutibacter sp.]
MIKKILIIIVFVITTNSLFAQQFRQKIHLLKSSYITNALNLTSKEAEKFWPVYNLYSDKIHELKFELEGNLDKKLLKNGNLAAISDSDAEKYLNNSLQMEQEIVTQKIKMQKELSKIISSKKIILLQKAEKDFNRRMLQEYGRRKGMMKQ